MSFNLNTKVNNLQFQVNQILAGSVSNPMTSNLNANNKQITNINTVSSVSGSPLNLTAGASTINCASAVNMVNTLTINNNTVNNGLVVADSAGDTSCFVVDKDGNVGVKANPANPINASLFVNGNTTVTNDLKVDGLLIANGGVTAPNLVSNVTAGTGLTKTGVSTNPTLSITPVGTAGTYAYPTSVVTNNLGQVTSITAGSAPTVNTTISNMAYNLTLNPDATVGNALRVVPIIAGSGVTLSSLGINPALYRYIEVSMGFSAQSQININYYTFYALGNDGSIGANALGNSVYYGDASMLRSYYANFVMDKTKGHFTNSTTSINMIKDDSFAPFPNGFILANTAFLTMSVKAYN